MPARALAIIPARFASVRFPGKPLADQTGRPLIQHVVERVREASSVDRVVVATDDRRIADAVAGFGGEAVMTGEHPNGTSRIAEAVRVLERDHAEGAALPDLILNVQGDEPEIPTATIDRLVQGLADDPGCAMATLASPFAEDEDPHDPNIVKVMVDRAGRAMLFSRACIPHARDARGGVGTGDAAPLKHPGLYAYRRGFPAIYAALPETPGERAEKLEQLRVLEHGHPIRIIHAPAPHPGIDTPAQYAAFVTRWRDAQTNDTP